MGQLVADDVDSSGEVREELVSVAKHHLHPVWVPVCVVPLILSGFPAMRNVYLHAFSYFTPKCTVLRTCIFLLSSEFQL